MTAESLSSDGPLERGFSTFKSEAFRFETLPSYKITGTPEYDEFQYYLSGGLLPRIAHRDWCEKVEEWVRQGKAVTRVRLLPEPPTPYVRFQLDWGYPYNCHYGERVLLLKEGACAAEEGDRLGDFWLFDQETAVRLAYSELGEYLGAEAVEDPSPFLRLRQSALGRAVPFPEYLRSVRQGCPSFLG